MANDITGQDILSAYRASIHPDVQKKFLKVNDISEKYKLTPGTETDFNNAATFYMYAQVKNSDAIDKAETDLSRLFGSVLEDYYTTYVNNGKLTSMLSAINEYNKEIDKLYTQNDSANAERILKNIYGIDPKTFEITEGSYAYRVLLELRERYVNRILPRVEIYEMLLRLRERINPYSNELYSGESSINSDTLHTIMQVIDEEFIKSSGILENPTITYTYVIEEDNHEVQKTITMHLVNGTISIEDSGITNTTFTTRISDNTTDNWRALFAHLLGFLYVYGNTNDDTYVDIEGQLFNETQTTFTFSSDPIAANNITYNFSSYEKQFLLFSTFLYIYNKIYNSTDNVVVESVDDHQSNIESLIKYNDDMSEILVELNDGVEGVANTRLMVNEYDIYNTIKIKLSETIQLPDINIKIGYLKDPYIQLRGNNDTQSIQGYRFENCILEELPYTQNRISKEVIMDSRNVYSAVQGANNENTNGILRDSVPPGLFIYPEIRKSYAILDAKNLYIYLKTIAADPTNPNRIGRITVGHQDYHDYKVIFDDINNTNLFSKVAHGDYKTYIYEDKTTALYSEIKNNSSFIRKTLIPSDEADDLECGGDFEKEYDVVLNSFKIYYEFNKPSAQISDKSMDDLLLSEKRHASDVEAYYALNYNNVNYFEFDNIIVDVKSSIYEELSSMFFKDNAERSDANIYGFRPGTNDQYTIVSFSVLYKEFNPIVRDIDLSNIQNRIISEYYQEVSQNILNTKIYDYISDYKNVEPIGAIPTDMGKIFVNLHTNPYIIRHSTVDDIVSYISGDIIGFGSSSQEKDEVQMLLNIYKETRDYFYKVLLNKAFVLEDQYTLFKHLYIKAYSIERFISSRLTNITEIKYYTTTDCRNFLISYGLKTLSDQVDAADFADSLVYKKRIIANYNTLMSSKGSRAIIDEFFKLFNYDTTEIELYKYLLYKDTPTHTEGNTTYLNTNYDEMLKFVPIKYESANISYGIKNNAKKAKKYNEFLVRDDYWDENELTPQIMAEAFDSPINTKYMGIDLKKDIYMSYIKSKYVLSLIQYLYTQFENKIYADNMSEEKKYLNNIKIALTSADSAGEDTGDEHTLLEMYNAVRFLFALYVTLSETAYGGNSGDDAVPSAKYTGIAHNSNKHAFYGINPNAHIDNFEFKNTFLTVDLVKKLFTTEYITDNKTLSSDSIEFYANGLYRTPGKAIRSPSSNEASELLFGQNTALPVDYMIPLRLETPATAARNKLFDTTDFANLKANTEEIFTDDTESIEMDSEENSSFSCIDDAFKSINLINFLNDLDINGDKDENNKKFQAVYYFEKFANSKAIYPTALSELGQLSDPSVEFKFPESGNFYSYIFEKVLEFPLNYLDGEYNITKNINYTYDVREILTEIFNNFYVVSGSGADDAVGYLNSTYNDNTGVFTFNNTAFVNETLGTDPSNINPVVVELLEDVASSITKGSGNNGKWKFSLPTDIDTTISTIADRLIAVCGIINTAAEQYQTMKLELQFGESLNNFFDFIKTCISFFISYTSMLYESNLILKIETKNERIPLTYKIYDKIEQNQHDYFYYDEDIKVDEIIDS